MMLDILSLSALWFFILIIWMKTNAFVEYARLFCVEYIAEYEMIAKDIAGYTYLTYLQEHKNTFFTRLITCPICLSVWWFIVISIFFNFTVGILSAFLGLYFYLTMASLLNEQPRS